MILFKTPPFYLGLTLLLSACSTTPKDRTDTHRVELPERWEASEASFEEGSSLWIEQWNLEELNSLIKVGLENNKDLAIAATRVDRVLADLKIIGADQLPQLSAEGRGNRGKFITSETPTVSTEIGNNFNTNISLSWEIDLWSRIRDNKKAATGDAEATFYDYEYARVSLGTQIAKIWFNITAANAQIQLGKETVETYRIQKEQIERQYDRGLIDVLDLRLIEAQENDAKANLEERLRLKAEYQRSLNLLLGQYPNANIDVPSYFPELPKPIPKVLPSDLLRKRPDLRSAERRLSAAERSVSAAKKLRLPTFSLVGSLGTSSTELDNIVNSDFQVWNLLGNITLPLFQAGKISGTISKSKSNYNQALLSYEKIILSSLAEVENGLAAENYLSRQYEHIKKSAQQNETASKIAAERYDRGLIDIITVLESQRRANIAETNRISLANQQFQNRLNLLLALGGGWNHSEL